MPVLGSGVAPPDFVYSNEDNIRNASCPYPRLGRSG